jgi:predicted nucleic acid-binding Zn ribbon protein
MSFRENKSRGPELVGDVLGRLFTARGWGRQSERQRLEDAWAQAVGESGAKQTRVSGVRRGVLEIDVANGMLMQELAGFHKRRLLNSLKEQLPGMPLKDIRFRSGKI